MEKTFELKKYFPLFQVWFKIPTSTEMWDHHLGLGSGLWLDTYLCYVNVATNYSNIWKSITNTFLVAWYDIISLIKSGNAGTILGFCLAIN